jgi:hypothetical protein
VNKIFKTLLLSVATVTFFAACDDDDNPTSSGGDPAVETAQVRVAHLSPDAPPVDVWVDGSLVLEDVAFRAFSGYLELDEGMHQVVVVAANTTTPAVIDAMVDVDAGMEYTVAATGLLSDASIAPAVFVDDVEPTDGKAEIRFVHASPDAPPVDITLLDGTKLFPNVEFGRAGDGIAVDAGAYSLQVRVANTETVALSFADVPVSAGMNYTVYAIGLLADGSIDAIVSVDRIAETTTTVDLTPATADVRVAHLVPGGPNVDVWVDGEKQLSGVPFEAISDYLPLSAATHAIRVVVANTTNDIFPEATLTFLPNTASTVAATGLVSDIQPRVFEDSRASAPMNNSFARFVHTSPDAPRVDIAVVDGPVLFAGFGFGESSDYAQVAAGSYDLEVRVASEPAGRGALVKTFNGVSLQSTASYSIFATGLAAELNAKPVQDNQ